MVRPPWPFETKRRRAYPKKRRIALDEYSRLVVRFFILGQNLTPFRGVKGKFSRDRQFFNLVPVYFKNYKSPPHITFTSVFPVQFCTNLCIFIVS